MVFPLLKLVLSTGMMGGVPEVTHLESGGPQGAKAITSHSLPYTTYPQHLCHPTVT